MNDKVFERYLPKNLLKVKKGKKGGGDEESRGNEYDARDSKDCWVEHEDVAHLQSSDWE